jgi:hypothetical protein
MCKPTHFAYSVLVLFLPTLLGQPCACHCRLALRSILRSQRRPYSRRRRERVAGLFSSPLLHKDLTSDRRMVDSTKPEECGGDGKEIAIESVLRDLDDAPLREDIDTQRKRATSKGWLDSDGLASELVLRRRISMLGRFVVVVPFFQGAYLLWTEWPSRLESAHAYDVFPLFQ